MINSTLSVCVESAPKPSLAGATTISLADPWNMRVEMPSWSGTCQEVAAQLDELIARLSTPHQVLNRRQELGRTLAVNNLRRARQVLVTAADATWSSSEARTDDVREWLEQGEYLDPNDVDWPPEP